MATTIIEIKRLRRLGSLNYRKAERLKERRDPMSRVYRAASLQFYGEAAALIMANAAL